MSTMILPDDIIATISRFLPPVCCAGACTVSKQYERVFVTIAMLQSPTVNYHCYVRTRQVFTIDDLYMGGCVNIVKLYAKHTRPRIFYRDVRRVAGLGHEALCDWMLTQKPDAMMNISAYMGVCYQRQDHLLAKYSSCLRMLVPDHVCSLISDISSCASVAAVMHTISTARKIVTDDVGSTDDVKFVNDAYQRFLEHALGGLCRRKRGKTPTTGVPLGASIDVPEGTLTEILQILDYILAHGYNINASDILAAANSAYVSVMLPKLLTHGNITMNDCLGTFCEIPQCPRDKLNKLVEHGATACVSCGWTCGKPHE